MKRLTQIALVGSLLLAVVLLAARKFRKFLDKY